MAIPSAPRLQFEMEEALSCPICFCSYDLERHLPKVFPCQHTMCLRCAEQLYEGRETVLVGNAFHCPTCRHLVTVPPAGPTGLTTNFDVRNMVQILANTEHTENTENTEHSEVQDPLCRKHRTAFVTNVCMHCEVGICPNCISADEFRAHSEHMSEVLEIGVAFRVLKSKFDYLEQQSKKVRSLLSERGNTIENLIRPVRGDCVSKNLRIFQGLKTLASVLRNSEFVDPVSGMKSDHGVDEFPDTKCDARAIKHATACIQAGKSALDSYDKALPETAMCIKLSAVAVQVDLLRLQLSCKNTRRMVATLTNLWHLLDESVPCCHRLIVLAGIDLLASCFSLCQTEQKLLRPLLEVLGSLAEHQIFHNHIVTTPIVSQLVVVLQTFTMKDEQAPERSCRVLAHILSNASVTWPLGCVSCEETSRLVIEASKQFGRLQTFTKTSFHHELRLMSQQTSPAAKHWAIWWLHQCMLKHPKRYAQILVAQGAVPVLENQTSSDDYVRDKCSEVNRKINEVRTRSTVCTLL